MADTGTTRHRAVFLDRDGTIASDIPYCRRIEDFKILPGVPSAIGLLNRQGFRVVVITNQSGIARGYYTEETLTLIHNKMRGELREAGASIDAIYVCPHHPDERCECRKPKPTLIMKAADDLGILLEHSYMVGDDAKDIQAGRAAGCRTIWLTADPTFQRQVSGPPSDHIAANLSEAVEWLLSDAVRRL